MSLTWTDYSKVMSTKYNMLLSSRFLQQSLFLNVFNKKINAQITK